MTDPTNRAIPQAQPQILYVCDPCMEGAPEGCGKYSPDDVRKAPDGICEDCFDNASEGDFGIAVNHDDAEQPQFSALPPASKHTASAALIETLKEALRDALTMVEDKIPINTYNWRIAWAKQARAALADGEKG